MPPFTSDSNTTALLPASPVASNSNATSTSPSGDSGVNVADAETPLPCASFKGSPVALSMSTPETTYSLPGMRFS